MSKITKNQQSTQGEPSINDDGDFSMAVNVKARLVLLWLAWLIIVLGYQAVVPARLSLVKPDFVLPWTANETSLRSLDNKPYLTDPFMNAQVSWDSEFYISIATSGYDDPKVRVVNPPSGTPPPFDRPLSLNYAYFPAYPYAIRAVEFPLTIFGLDIVATATLAGVIVSALGAFAAMTALYDLTRKELGDSGAFRAVFYLLVFPTGFYLAQVYTEGMFIGLSFACLALSRRNQWLLATSCAVIAALTRPVGAALVIPLALAWLREWRARRVFSSRLLAQGFLGAAPLLAYALYRLSFNGIAFDLVERLFYGRELFALDKTYWVWSSAFASFSGNNPQAAVHYGLEFSLMALGLVTSVLTLRRYPDLALFSLAVILIPLSTVQVESIMRYVLAAPSVFLMLSRWGRHVVFDRTWTLVSILLMAMLTTLFTFNMWVA